MSRQITQIGALETYIADKHQNTHTGIYIYIYTLNFSFFPFGDWAFSEVGGQIPMLLNYPILLFFFSRIKCTYK